MLDVFLLAAVANASTCWRSPILFQLQAAARYSQGMSRRQALDVTESGRRFIEVQPEQQEIRDGETVQFAGNIGMGSDTIHRVAEYKKILQLRVVEGLDAEVIARAKQDLVAGVPDGKRKIASKIVNAARAPKGITSQD